MERQRDRHLQRIMDDTMGGNSQTRSRGTLDLPAEEEEWATGLGFPHAIQQPSMYSGFDPASYDSNLPLQSSFGAVPGPSRLSFAPRNAHNQLVAPPRTLNNADNHFRFTQNLRQGMPLSQPAQRPHIPQSTDTIGHLVDAMLAQQPLPQSRPELTSTFRTEYTHEPETANFFQGLHTSRLSQLQPQRQQVTPPFNLMLTVEDGFAYSPTDEQESGSSSPIVRQHSSPTTRASLRRASHNIVTHQGNEQREVPNTLLKTPPRQDNPTRNTPQTLALGHAPPIAHGIQLVSPHDLPDRFRHVFPYELFNAVQSKCFDPIYKSNDNIVISAPTGSGKTALLELAICKLVEGHKLGHFKIVYQAPTKSLCSERLRDWQKKFSHLNLPCAELTGDTTQAEMNRVRSASIIVTTPEKWDSITRKWTDHVKLVQMVKLFLIDEVHILKDTRGATLEAVVSRMKSMGADLRFVALSATVPNSSDIALWLGKDHTNQHLPAHRETFGEELRPVKLMKWVHGFDGLMNDFAFEKILDGKLPALIHQYSQKKPIMVFCFTRKSCENTANILAENWTRQRVTDRAWPAPTQRTNVGSKELQQLVTCGVAFHHAGLDLQDRHTIETAFLKGDISVICCTSTLAVGVNLPCHLVVLKGTVGFQDGKLCEYSDLEVMQMLGRAGRPQFDDRAVAVIMTRSDKVERYKRMISGQDILESTLHLNLIEHLNSEISLGTVNDLYKAKRWINGTFLSVRMRQNPTYYRIDGVPDSGNTDQRLEQVCERDIKLLQEHSLVTEEERFTCTEYGLAMSRYMVQFETMKVLLSIPRQAKTEQILHAICQAAEFRDLRMKPVERPFLREFNKSPLIKYPVKDNITHTAHKIFLMIQVQLGGIELPTEKDFTAIKRQFLTDKSILFERVHRLIRCVIDCKAVNCDAISTRHALDLARSLSSEFWENSSLQLRQIPQMGPVALTKLTSSGINTIEKLDGCDTATIERAMSKNPPYGKKIKDALIGFPRLNLAADIMGKVTVKPGHFPRVNVKAQLSYDNNTVPVWGCKKPSITFMAETSDGTLVHFWRGNILRLEKNYELRFNVELSGPAEIIRCWIACEEIVGTIKTCILQPSIPASAFPSPCTNTATKTESPDATNKIHDEFDFGADEVGDDEMLAAVKGVEATSSYGSDDFADIDDFESDLKVTTKSKKKTKPMKESEDSKETEMIESVQMANGKWTCNHICRDGAPCKNGKPCKHRCCKEGLDKPRKLVKKSSKPQSHSDTKPFSKNKKDLTDVKFKPETLSPSQISDTELVDLAQVLSPVPYDKIAPREYRKLHDLHTKVQSDRAIRLPKFKPQFSYSSGEQPELPFLQSNEDEEESLDLQKPDEQPQESELSGSLHDDMNTFNDAFFEEMSKADEDVPPSFRNDSTQSLEAGMMELSEPSVPVSAPHVSQTDGGFSNGVFDFDAYENVVGINQMQPDFSMEGQTKEEVSPSSRAQNPPKRAMSAEQEEPEAKHRRVTKDEPATQQSQLPAWVNDFDPSLIDSLKDFVDFV
ncbi:hypothetical protein EG329_003673 [Mollisiaceae sp. DMI_Dod_QoI]|nr:hypothetical protein EG329_003673 [Helotiales sp. DMI_Dod_QoI]